jgi:hypothetical protein
LNRNWRSAVSERSGRQTKPCSGGSTHIIFVVGHSCGGRGRCTALGAAEGLFGAWGERIGSSGGAGVSQYSSASAVSGRREVECSYSAALRWRIKLLVLLPSAAAVVTARLAVNDLSREPSSSALASTVEPSRPTSAPPLLEQPTRFQYVLRFQFFYLDGSGQFWRMLRRRRLHTYSSHSSCGPPANQRHYLPLAATHFTNHGNTSRRRWL